MIIIDDIFIYSLEEYDKYKDHIMNQCEVNNSRAYLRLNVRNNEKVALETLSLISRNIANKQYDIKNCYFRCCEKYHSDKDKKWIVDLDGKQVDLILKIEEFIKELHKESGNKVYRIITEIPTKNGVHIISNPFNVEKFKNMFLDIEIHKDNPTVLFQYN